MSTDRVDSTSRRGARDMPGRPTIEDRHALGRIVFRLNIVKPPLPLVRNRRILQENLIWNRQPEFVCCKYDA